MALLDLSTEILANVFSHVGTGIVARRYFFSLVLSCKPLYLIGLAFLYGDTTICLPAERVTITKGNKILRKICFKTPDRCAWVYTVRVRWDMAIPDPAIEFLELLTSFSSLRTLIIFPAGAALALYFPLSRTSLCSCENPPDSIK